MPPFFPFDEARQFTVSADFSALMKIDPAMTMTKDYAYALLCNYLFVHDEVVIQRACTDDGMVIRLTDPLRRLLKLSDDIVHIYVEGRSGRFEPHLMPQYDTLMWWVPLVRRSGLLDPHLVPLCRPLWVLLGTDHDTVEDEPFVFFSGIFATEAQAASKRDELNHETMQKYGRRDYCIKQVEQNTYYPYCFSYE